MLITVGDNSRRGRSTMTSDVFVIVAAYDEADRIAATLAALAEAFPGAPLWVADDGSSDGTGAIAQATGATVVRSERVIGKGRSGNACGAEAREALAGRREARGGCGSGCWRGSRGAGVEKIVAAAMEIWASPRRCWARSSRLYTKTRRISRWEFSPSVSVAASGWRSALPAGRSAGVVDLNRERPFPGSGR